MADGGFSGLACTFLVVVFLYSQQLPAQLLEVSCITISQHLTSLHGCRVSKLMDFFVTTLSD